MKRYKLLFVVLTSTFSTTSVTCFILHSHIQGRSQAPPVSSRLFLKHPD